MSSPDEVFDKLLERDRRQRDVIVTMAAAITQAIEYVAPAAKKNSGKGDEAMAVLSHLVRALHVAVELANNSAKDAAA